MVLKYAAFLVTDQLHLSSEWCEEAIGGENTQKRTDECRTDFVTDFSRRAIDVSHRDHDTENGGDDSEARETVRGFREDADRKVMFFFHRFQFDIHQVTDILRADRSVDYRSECSLDKVGCMVIGGQFGIFGKYSALMRVCDMAFEGEQPISTSDSKQFVRALRTFPRKIVYCTETPSTPG